MELRDSGTSISSLLYFYSLDVEYILLNFPSHPRRFRGPLTIQTLNLPPTDDSVMAPSTT